jgi:Mrp family chromosome partitioning ATPase
MELAFLTGAVRRYYWMIALGALLGLVPGILASRGGATEFESTAVLLVAPPSQSLLQVSFAGDPDRYVAGQLSVLRSQLLAEQVADEVGDDGPGAVAKSVHFDREPLTDVVRVVASTPSPERSQAIADAYVNLYLEHLHNQVEGSQQPTIDRLDAELESIRDQLTDIDEQIADVIQPFLGRDPIPTIDQVAPGLLSDKSILLNQFAELQSSRTELSTGLRVSTEIVQSATLPAAPSPASGKALLAVGLVAGAFMGLVAASVAARLSPTILGDGQAEDILGVAIVGALPALPKPRPGAHLFFGELSPTASRFVESLCVRAEAAAEDASTLTVVVAGSEPGSATASLAEVLALRFAAPGTRVLLVDAGRRDPSTSARLSTEVRSEAVSAGVAAGGVGVGPFSGPRPPSLRSMTLSELAGLSSPSVDGGSVTRRADVTKLLAAATAEAEVVVFDGGPLMESVVTVQLAWQCDVVVLAMPRNQRIRSLEVVAAELSDCQSVMPVWTDPVRRRGAHT